MGISALVATALTSLGVGAETAGVLAPIISSGAIGAGMSGLTGQPILKGLLGGAVMGGMGELMGGAAGGAGAMSGLGSNPNGVASAGGFSPVEVTPQRTMADALGGGAGTLAAGISRGLNGNNGTLSSLLALGNMLTSPKPQAPNPGPFFNKPWETGGYLSRSMTGAHPANYATAGETGEPTYFNDNQLNFASGHARGGAISAMRGFSTGGGEHYLDGGEGGQDDTEHAMLSDGEYVFDAGSVSRLGDGNSAAGARRLDMIRKKIADDTGAKKVVQTKAKSPMHYLSEARAA